jgi:hypothetical protein
MVYAFGNPVYGRFAPACCCSEQQLEEWNMGGREREIYKRFNID